MNFKVFGKWDSTNLVVRDIGIRAYLNTGGNTVPHSYGKYAKVKFGNSHYSMVERLANKMMVTGHLKDNRTHKKASGRDSGKKQKALKSVRKSLEIIEKKTSENPLQVLIRAVEYSAPIEETTRIRQGGIIAHRPVNVAPIRRVDLALRFLSHGASARSFKSKQSVETSLAAEIIAAGSGDQKCYAVSKRDELERVAASAR
ncbi:TPA: 30S ribosomal protein S7 [archaeon]|nr:30S ribosomal protein S7 [Candidatus Undinarchaeales archaeon SRR5007147.bin71]